MAEEVRRQLSERTVDTCRNAKDTQAALRGACHEKRAGQVRDGTGTLGGFSAKGTMMMIVLIKPSPSV